MTTSEIARSFREKVSASVEVVSEGVQRFRVDTPFRRRNFRLELAQPQGHLPEPDPVEGHEGELGLPP